MLSHGYVARNQGSGRIPPSPQNLRNKKLLSKQLPGRMFIYVFRDMLFCMYMRVESYINIATPMNQCVYMFIAIK